MKKIYQIKIASIFFLLFITGNSLFCQDIYELENNLFVRLLAYQNLQLQIDSLNQSLESISNRLTSLRKNKVKNEEEIMAVMSSSVAVTNKIKTLKEDQLVRGERIKTIRTKLYKLYDAKIDSLKHLDPSAKNTLISQQIMDLTDKKLLVQPKMGILSINPLKLLNINIQTSKSLHKDLLKEYFTKAITEVDSHLVILSNSIDETDEILRLKQQTESFLEESYLEHETRPMNLFSNTQTAIPPGDWEDTFTEGDRGNTGDLNSIKNNTLLGANTFATILKQLSEYNSAIHQSVYSRYSNKEANISLEDYYSLLKETKNRLHEYRSVLIKRLNLFNESN